LEQGNEAEKRTKHSFPSKRYVSLKWREWDIKWWRISKTRYQNRRV